MTNVRDVRRNRKNNLSVSIAELVDGSAQTDDQHTEKIVAEKGTQSGDGQLEIAFSPDLKPMRVQNSES